MDNILEELWYGNVNPYEAVGEEGPHEKELLSLMARNREKLTEQMDGDAESVLEKYDENIQELHAIGEKKAFIYGFRLGVRLLEATNNETDHH